MSFDLVIALCEARGEQVKQLTAERDQLRAEVVERAARCGNLEGQLEAMRGEVDRLRAQLALRDDDLRIERQRVADYGAMVERMRAEIAQINEDDRLAVAHWGESIAAYDADLAKLRGLVRELVTASENPKALAPRRWDDLLKRAREAAGEAK